MASTWTNGGLKRVLDGTLNLNTATLKVMLLGIAYVIDADHEFASSLTAHELNGTGYTGGFGGGGRKTLAGKAFAKDDALNCATLDVTDPVWAGADAGTVGCAAIITEITNDAASPVIALLELSPPVEMRSGSFTLQLGAFLLKLRAGA
jgi:hypothetical protein